MEKRKFGKTDMEFSVLGFGGAEIGWNGESAETVEELLNSALDAGLNVIDTAAAYKDSEKKIGEAVGRRRKEYYLLTKCGALDAFTRFDWSKKGILETIENSLRNLKTDYLDIAQRMEIAEPLVHSGDRHRRTLAGAILLAGHVVHLLRAVRIEDRVGLRERHFGVDPVNG